MWITVFVCYWIQKTSDETKMKSKYLENILSWGQDFSRWFKLFIFWLLASCHICPNRTMYHCDDAQNDLCSTSKKSKYTQIHLSAKGQILLALKSGEKKDMVKSLLLHLMLKEQKTRV